MTEQTPAAALADALQEDALASFIPPMPLTVTPEDWISYGERAFAEIKRLRSALQKIAARTCCAG